MRTFIFIKTIKKDGQKPYRAIVGMRQSNTYPSGMTTDPESEFYACDCLEISENCHVKLPELEFKQQSENKPSGRIKIIEKGDRIEIECPYNTWFVYQIKNIGGARWTGERWSVPADMIEEVRKELIEDFGENDIERAACVDLKIKTKKELQESCGPVTMFFKDIASARGRDSGAKVGTDVSLLSGKIYSCGSAKNWKTAIEAGSEFLIKNVNKKVFEKFENEYDIDVEIVKE